MDVLDAIRSLLQETAASQSGDPLLQLVEAYAGCQGSYGVGSRVCSYTRTGESFVLQVWFRCVTCNVRVILRHCVVSS